jgi:hypothetical protein
MRNQTQSEQPINPAMHQPFTFKFQMMLIGNASKYIRIIYKVGTGKTSYVAALNLTPPLSSYKATVGIDYIEKTLSINENTVLVLVFDCVRLQVYSKYTGWSRKIQTFISLLERYWDLHLHLRYNKVRSGTAANVTLVAARSMLLSITI